MILTNQDVEEIIAILDNTPHDELHLTTEKFELHLRRAGGGWTQETRTLSKPKILEAEATPAPKAEMNALQEGDVEGLASVRAPMVGTFYRAPKPGAAPFVEVGARVGEHTVVAIVETMKLMNSIPAGVEGEVATILAADGQLVEQGQLDHAHQAADVNIRRVFIANRGEIAVRVLRTCRNLGIETVLGASEADMDSTPARLADRTICIGPPRSSDSYLNIEAVVDAALRAKADAIHPGYGFLSENARFARAVRERGLIFIGPTEANLEAVGDKLRARGHAIDANLPLAPGGSVDDPAEAAALARSVGYPLLVKAVGGGGGRGMKRVDAPERLGDRISLAMAEAGAAFGDSRVYLERFVASGRHVEVQILGDGEDVIHLGDRDCSVQRRYQKLVEEAPAPDIPELLRERMRAAAVAFGKHLNYVGLGTVEFLYDRTRAEFYFLEMNARIQVEHPVTEAITGLDLVAEQIAIAEGRKLRLQQNEVRLNGHALECRLNAEDWTRDFQPSPGTIVSARFPAGQGVRVDTHIEAGAKIPPFYDSLMAKIVVNGDTRAQALAGMHAALGRLETTGVATNRDMHLALMADAEFAHGGVDTAFFPRWLEARAK